MLNGCVYTIGSTPGKGVYVLYSRLMGHPSMPNLTRVIDVAVSVASAVATSHTKVTIFSTFVHSIIM